MSRKASPQPPSLPPPRSYAQEDLPLPPDDPTKRVMGRVTVLGLRLYQYWRNLGAVFLIALALLTLFGLTGLSSGSLLIAWAGFLRRWLGWGAILVPASLGWLAWLQLAPHALHAGAPIRIHWWRVIAGEGAAVALLGLLNLAIGKDVGVAAAGQGGGLIGWSIGYLIGALLPAPADGLLLLALFVFGIFLASEVTSDRLGRVLDWLQSFGFEGGSPNSAARPSVRQPAVAPGPIAEPMTTRETTPARRPRTKIAANERVRVPVETADDHVKPKLKKRAAVLPDLALLDNSEGRKPVQKDIDETGSVIVKNF